jgi:hypothetical protein
LFSWPAQVLAKRRSARRKLIAVAQPRVPRAKNVTGPT